MLCTGAKTTSKTGILDKAEIPSEADYFLQRIHYLALTERIRTLAVTAVTTILFPVAYFAT